MEIAAIPTTYKGIELKSRMEAQCAVLFDKLGWAWEYEPFSLMLPSGITYIPDFWVPNLALLIECRGYQSERGDRQIAEFAGLVRTAEVTLPDVVAQRFFEYMVIGPEFSFGYGPGMDDFHAGLIYQCSECRQWSRFIARPLCIKCANYTNGMVAHISIKSGKIFLNGVPVEDLAL